MTNEIKNVPELRFKEFSKEWEDNNLKDITTLLKDGTHGTHKDVENGPWLLSAKNIKNNTINISDEDRKISITDYNKIYKNYTLEREDILLSIVGTIGRVSMVKDPVNIAFQRSVAIIRFSKPLESKFFLYLFGTKEFKKKLYRNQVVSAQPGIYLGDLAKFNIIYPLVIEEQQKIGDFFSKLDRQIELEEQKLAKLEEQKKGYMQKIFSQELRFKDDNGNDYPNWENEKLGDLINEVNERTTSNNQYVLLSSTKNGLLSQEEYFKKQIGSKDSTGYKILRLNQLVLSPQNLWLGNINFNQCFDIGIVSPSYRIYNLSHQFDINFAKDLLKSPRYIYEYAQASEQGASVVRRNLNLELFYSIKISLPSIEEQRKIGVFLNKLDNLIKKQSDKVELLKERKKGFLQKMFV